MIELVVLLKLVPDIRHIPEDAWDLERGTLRRNRLTLIPNVMDDRALALALRIRDVWGGRITALSMGPPAAKGLCSRALAFGADRAVLITDPACAGSDTLATATVLSRTVTHLCPDTTQVLVLAGMQSPDGDTAQVPVQVAAMLGASVVPYVTSSWFYGASAEGTAARNPAGAAAPPGAALDLTSISSSGAARARLTPADLPAVVTCTDQLPSIPFHTSLAQLKRASSSGPEIVTAADVGLPEDQVGLAGSATRVVSISVAESVRRKVEVVDWPDHGDHIRAAAALVARLEAALSGASENVSTAAGEGASPGGGPYKRDEPSMQDAPARHRSGDDGRAPAGDTGMPPAAVWAVVDADPDIHQLAILAHARGIADAMGCPTVACRVMDGRGAAETDGGVGADAGANPDPLLRAALGTAGATDLLTITGEGAAEPVALARALEQAVERFAPRVLLLPASPEGRVSAPYLAARLGAGLTADCTSFAVKEYSRRQAGERRTYPDALYQRRPALGGNIAATIVSPRNIERGLPQMATVRPGPTGEHRSGGVRAHRWAAPVGVGSTRAAGLQAPGPGAGVPGTEGGSERRGGETAGATEAGRVRIERCKVLVSVGRGMGGQAGIDELARPLAEALRERFGVDVEVSASRVVVDAGDLERERQVGQTGKTVRPDIYLALGISGSVQHRAGMDSSATIVSVNADAEAPMRMISDVFVHGRVQDVVPPLIRALRE